MMWLENFKLQLQSVLEALFVVLKVELLNDSGKIVRVKLWVRRVCEPKPFFVHFKFLLKFNQKSIQRSITIATKSVASSRLFQLKTSPKTM